MGRRMAGFLLLLVVLVAAAAPLPAGATNHPTLRQGSRGDYVRLAQRKLSQWHYYRGAVDGSFGPRTREAVLFFQRRNGLVADGIIGPRTWRALGENVPDRRAAAPAAQPARRQDDLELLARVISAEAKGEPYEGQVAVGAVILNRIRDSRFPNTLAGVIYQTHAFESISNGEAYKAAVPSARRAAQDAMNGWDPSGGALFFWNPYKPVSDWIWSRPIQKQIGQHVFAK